MLWLTYSSLLASALLPSRTCLKCLCAGAATPRRVPHVVAVLPWAGAGSRLTRRQPDGLDSVGPERARVGGRCSRSVLREFKGPGGRGEAAGRRRDACRHAQAGRVSLGLIGVMAILALVITGSLFAFPSYTDIGPGSCWLRWGRACGPQVLESRESLAGVTVSRRGRGVRRGWRSWNQRNHGRKRDDRCRSVERRHR